MSKLNDFIKTRTPAFWLLCLSAVFVLIGLILALVSCSAPNGAYRMLNQGVFIALSIIAIVVIAGILVAGAFLEEKLWMSILPVVVIVLLGFSIYILFMGKMDLMGTIWFSELDRGNAVAESALNNGVVGLVFYVLAALALGIGCCFRFSKD